ncbi:MAG: GlsB/YeaQ/YmgE family stress response membrane protein [Pirellulales bacterium]|nr:GlsB/YeaQ/YmgE family stress response membrane protein [Pirellulales bacterium]
MNIVYFLLVGLVAGWLAGKFMGTSGYGLMGDLVLGVIGAVVGGFVFGLLGLAAVGLLGKLVTATVGAILFIALLRVIKRA